MPPSGKFLPYLAVLLTAVACLALNASFKRWNTNEGVIANDIHHYYGYLPAKFIFDDIKVLKSDYQSAENSFFFWTFETPEGKRIFKTTVGLAYLYSPFFAVAHWYTLQSDFPANGFSEPYQVMLLMSTVFYLVLGLLITVSLLRTLGFNHITIATTILIIGLGTNLLSYATVLAPMPHVYSFFLFASLIWLSLRWLDSDDVSIYILIGLTLGCITLIRPSNVVIVVFCLSIWGRKCLSQSAFKKFFLLSLPFCILPWIPQMIYWKEVAGSYFVDPYLNEHFNFLNPQILEGLFSFQKGWLIYTPIMFFSILGLFVMRSGVSHTRFPISAFIAVNVFIIFSWWCWWYGEGLGQRALIESYALLSIPLASFVYHVLERNTWRKLTFLSLAAFFIWLNMFQVIQYAHGSLHPDGMSRTLYFKQFGKVMPIENFDDYVVHVEYPAQKGQSKMQTEKIETVLIKSNKGKYLTWLDDDFKTVKASSETPDSNCFFKLIRLEHGNYAIKSSKGLLLCAEMDKGGFVTASRTSIGAWETFYLETIDKDAIALKGPDGKYLTVDPKTLRLHADKESIVNNEKFTIIYK